MTDFLGAIAARAFPQRDGLQPRLATRFETPRVDEMPLGTLRAPATTGSEPGTPAAEPQRDDSASALESRLEALDRLVRTLPKPGSSVTHQQTFHTTQPVTVHPSEVRVESHHDRNSVEHHHSRETTERLIEAHHHDEQRHHHHTEHTEHTERTERIEPIATEAIEPIATEAIAPAEDHPDGPPPASAVNVAAIPAKPRAERGKHRTETVMPRTERVVERETPGERIVETRSETHERVLEREHENTITPGERVIRERPGTRLVERILERTQTLSPRPPLIAERTSSAEPARPEPEPPSIHVTIGRIEIRATPTPETRPRAVAARASTLDEYLRRRDGGSR